jgi:hypothetical protein
MELLISAHLPVPRPEPPTPPQPGPRARPSKPPGAPRRRAVLHKTRAGETRARYLPLSSPQSPPPTRPPSSPPPPRGRLLPSDPTGVAHRAAPSLPTSLPTGYPCNNDGSLIRAFGSRDLFISPAKIAIFSSCALPAPVFRRRCRLIDMPARSGFRWFLSGWAIARLARSMGFFFL